MTPKRLLQTAVLLALLCPGAIRAEENKLNSDEVLALARYHQLQGRSSAGRDLVVELLNHQPENIAAIACVVRFLMKPDQLDHQQSREVEARQRNQKLNQKLKPRPDSGVVN